MNVCSLYFVDFRGRAAALDPAVIYSEVRQSSNGIGGGGVDTVTLL